MSAASDNRLTLVFPPLPSFKISPSTTALIVIDMQKADAHPEFGIGAKARAAGMDHVFGYYWNAVRQAVSHQQRLIQTARSVDIPVIYTRIATQTYNARDVGRQHRYVNIIVPKNSVDAEILSEIAPAANDIVISKTCSSPFNSTGIHQLLHNLGVDTLIVCGVVTNGCVEGTVRDASDLGYNVIMVPDACAAVTAELHQAAIMNLDNAFCNCRDTATILAELKGIQPIQLKENVR
jgi:nicotinamidase-related amidase